MRNTVLALSMLLVGTVLAGCLGADDTDVKVPETPDQETLWVLDAAGQRVDETTFGGPLPAYELLHASNRVSGEPTVGVTRTGAVFYAAIDFDVDAGPGGMLPSTIYYRSTDAGETWEDKSPQMAGVKTHPTSFDPYLYVDPTTGRVFAMDMGPHVACNKVSWSDDDGETWVSRDGACIPGANDHPTIWAGPATPLTVTDVYPNQLYMCTNQISDTLCYQSSTGGLDWFLATPAFLGYSADHANIIVDPTDPDAMVGGALDGLCGGLTGHGHSSWADGTVYLGRAYCGEVNVAVSHDDGVTFTRSIISQEPLHAPADHDVSIATDRSGNAYAFWVGNEARAVFLSTSQDMGVTWSEPINVTAPDVTAVKLPSIVAGEDGRIAFLYIGSETPLGWAVDDRECTTEDAPVPIVTSGETTCEWLHPDELDNTTWHAYVGMSLNADASEPVFATTLANPADQPLKRGPCSGRCTGAGFGMYDFLDIDIDPMTGQVYVALVDVCVDACDEPDAKYFDIEEDETSHGVVARLVGGVKLLDEPIAER